MSLDNVTPGSNVPHSFNVIIDLVKEASVDPNVLAIKQTLYRTGHQSPLVNALIEAARNGKDVTVVIELRARFDEEANLRLADRLQEAGVQVVYGVVGYKTHAKMLLILRREEAGEGKPTRFRRYVHLGTGNYHPRTSGMYTDFGLLTANDEIGADVHEVFKQLTGLGRAGELKHLWQAPFTLHSKLVAAIQAEADAARAGRKGRIIAKMNSLLEQQIVSALYEASEAGVEIDLIVRGVCALRPGVPGLSENIRVRSVVGRFLEHSRIFYFYADGSEKTYLSSADWMERNVFRRIEVCFPVLDDRLKRRVMKEGLRPYLHDNAQAWTMDANGNYGKPPSRRTRSVAQESLLLDLGASA